MATFDFKTATPVTSGLTDSYFYFGANSQSDASPNIYTLLALKTYVLGGATVALTVGAAAISSGTTTRILYDNAGVLGEYAVSGTGSVAMTNSPTLVTPTLGVATATSINKMAITAPATSSTLTIADGKTHVVSNSLTFTGTDSTSFAFPSTSDTVAVLGIAQTFTAAQTVKRDAIGSTSTDGFLLRNTTAAAAGAQQYSPRSVWEGQGWKTNATAASQAVAFMAEVRPVQGSANPTGTWALAASINGGAYSDSLTVTSIGGITTPSLSNTAAQSSIA